VPRHLQSVTSQDSEDGSDVLLPGPSRLEEIMRASTSMRDLLLCALAPENGLTENESQEVINTLLFTTRPITMVAWLIELAHSHPWEDNATIFVHGARELESPQQVALFILIEWLDHWDAATELEIFPALYAQAIEVIDSCDHDRTTVLGQSVATKLDEAARRVVTSLPSQEEGAEGTLGQPQDDPFFADEEDPGPYLMPAGSSENCEAELMGFLDEEVARRNSACWFGLSSAEFAAQRLTAERRGSVASWASAQSLESAHSNTSSVSHRRLKSFRSLLSIFRSRADSNNSLQVELMAHDFRQGLVSRLFKLSPNEVAIQLTLLVHDCIFTEVKLYELGRAVRAGRIRATMCPNLQRMVSVFEVIASWVELEVLAHANRSSSSRIRAISFFLRVAAACREQRSFHLLFAIVAGLGQTTLSWVWQHTPARERAAFEKLQRAVSPRQNYLVYRADLSKSPVPRVQPCGTGCMPFLGIWLKDASVMLEIRGGDGSRDALSLYSAYSLAKELLACQHSFTSCHRDDSIRELLSSLLQSTTINNEFRNQLSFTEHRRSSPRLTTMLSRRGFSTPEAALP